jgi:hypothetical protein
MTWELLWKILFVVIVALFVVMAVVTTIGGARDIKRLLIHLRNPEEDDPSADSDEETD